MYVPFLLSVPVYMVQCSLFFVIQLKSTTLNSTFLIGELLFTLSDFFIKIFWFLDCSVHCNSGLFEFFLSAIFIIDESIDCSLD